MNEKKTEATEGEHVVQPAGKSGYAEPRERENPDHRDAGQRHVERHNADEEPADE